MRLVVNRWLIFSKCVCSEEKQDQQLLQGQRNGLLSELQLNTRCQVVLAIANGYKTPTSVSAASRVARSGGANLNCGADAIVQQPGFEVQICPCARYNAHADALLPQALQLLNLGCELGRRHNAFCRVDLAYREGDDKHHPFQSGEFLRASSLEIASLLLCMTGYH